MTRSPRGDQAAHGHLWPSQATQVARVCKDSRILVPSWQHLLPMPTAPGDVPWPPEPTLINTTAGETWDWWLFAWYWPEPRDRQ